MFLENSNDNYQLANQLQMKIDELFDWDVNIGYETKEKRKGSVFISNKNNVKGLEFPFVICFMQNTLDDDLQNRNSIYMMLTRSFITSYFILPNDNQEDIKKMERGVDFVSRNGYLRVREPDSVQKRKLKNAVISKNNIHRSQQEIVNEIMDEINVEKTYRNRIHTVIKSAYEEELDYDRLFEIIRMNYNLMN